MWRFPTLPTLDRWTQYGEERVQIAQELHQNVDGILLWVALVCKELESVGSYDAVAVLRGMKLKDLYGCMMHQIEALKRMIQNITKASFQTITLAYQRLHLPEPAILRSLTTQVSVTEIKNAPPSLQYVNTSSTLFISRQRITSRSTQNLRSLPNGMQKACHNSVTIIGRYEKILWRDIYCLWDPGRLIE
jgi:hypothetical protein